MQSVFGVSIGVVMLAVASPLMVGGAIGMWLQSEKTRADAVASGALLVLVPTVALQSLVGETLAEWVSVSLGVLAVVCALAMWWAVFVEGLTLDSKREQEAVESIEASIEAANTDTDADEGTNTEESP
jgi:protein-S-isoprenylcysteine O-methyltransferase Ste14